MPFDGNNETTAFDTVDRMISILEKDRWIKHLDRAYVNGRYSYCLLGALDEAVGVNRNSCTVAIDLRNMLARIIIEDKKITGTSMDVIATFNDMGTTTHDDVMALLNEAQKHLAC